MVEAYAGIDVAYAKRKRLPIIVCTHRDGKLEPLPLRSLPAPPVGKGNAQILDQPAVAGFAEAVAEYLRSVEVAFGVGIKRIAIDAPSDPKGFGIKRRQCEIALDLKRISCITTPSASEFSNICKRATEHLARGGAESRMPGANQLWMLVGFALFERLRKDWECMEVFPQAIVAALNASQIHKSKSAGFAAQLKAISLQTGWPSLLIVRSLAEIGFGSSHDRLDAYMAAWVASLEDSEREPIGVPPNDVIWGPRMCSLAATEIHA
jgi:hypothetical protein